MIDSDELLELWPQLPDGMRHCSKHPTTQPFSRIEACGLCWRDVHVCERPPWLAEIPDYWRAEGDLLRCEHHPRHAFDEHEACLHCVEAQEP